MDLSIEKKNQRKLAAKKRLPIHQSFNNRFVDFNKLLQKNKWFEEGKIIASFLSIKTEISTNSLNQLIWRSKKILCLPVIKHDSDLLSFHRYKKTDKLIVGRFDIMEPDNNYECMPDVIFVPCLAFDLFGHRLGYGGGYYDKTLAYFNSLKHTFTVVGLAYDNQKVDEVIHDDLDQKLNYILTEKQLYKIL